MSRVNLKQLSNEASEKSWVVRGGGGVEAYITDHIALDAGVIYNYPFDVIEDTDTLAIALDRVFRFQLGTQSLGIVACSRSMAS